MEKTKFRVLTTISLLLVTGFLVTSLASYFVSLTSLREQISENELPLTSDNIYSEIQRDLLRPIFISSVMATDTFLRDWVIQGEEDVDKITRYLREIQNKYNTFTAFFVSDKTRIYYHSSGILKTVSEDEPRDVWYFRVRQMQQDYEINVDIDMANQDAMTIFINYRVYDYDGNYIGATGVGLTVYAVRTLIEEYQRTYDRTIYFVDEQGNLALRGSDFPEDVDSLEDMEQLAPFIPDILADRKHSFQYEKDGATTHLNTRFIPEFGWFLLVEQTESEVTRGILQTLLLNLGICCIITIVIVVLTTLTISSYQKRLEKLATTDKLTGICNRQAFDVILNHAIRDYQRHRRQFSLILFDIDHFKKVNDTYGHIVGDAVLKHIVRVTQKITRESDVFCRWGGEEFLILLYECSAGDAYRKAEEIREAVATNPTVYNGQSIPVTISSGIAEYNSPGGSENTLLEQVDQALYRAKANGRNRTETYAE